MRFRAVDKNLINNKTGPIHWAEVQDAFFMTPGLWSYRRDSSTGHCWLDPRPDDEFIPLIYQSYYTHIDFPSIKSSEKGLWRQSLAWAQSRALGYPLPKHTTWLAKLVSFMPTVADAATLDLMRLSSEEKGRLLDFGCGDGSFMKKMRDHGWDVVGLEPDVKAAVKLARNENIRVYSSIEEISLSETEPFDIVILNHVIEHLPDPVKSLRDLGLLMKCSSRLIVTTPNVSGLGARIFGRYWRGLEPPRHFNVFSPQSIKLAFGAANFKVVKLSTEVRMARSIWYLSFLARIGQKDLEIKRFKQHSVVKLCGYIFHLLESLIVKVAPELGEELFCIGLLLPPNNTSQLNNN